MWSIRESTVIARNTCPKILMNLRVVSSPEYEKVALVCHLSVSICVCMCALLAFEWLDGFYSYSVFKSLSAICQCPMNSKILVPKTEALEMVPPKKNPAILTKTALMISIIFH
jgi:hypothetical protein